MKLREMEAGMSGATGFVLHRFPAYRDLILLRLGADYRFRTMYADYKEASDALAVWEQSAAPRAAEFVRDYRRLVAELERDILSELLEHDDM
jgi:hypothetical protein